MNLDTILNASLNKADLTFDDYKLLLEKQNFKKRINKLEKLLKNKKIIVYGSGLFFSVINNNYDLSNLNIIGVSDKKFSKESSEKFEGYIVIPPDKLSEEGFDALLIATYHSRSVKEQLIFENNFLKKKTVIPFKEETIEEKLYEFWVSIY